MSYSEQDHASLKKIANQAIQYGLEHPGAFGTPEEMPVTIIESHDYPESLQNKRATFVTLHKHGDLRGCIGTLEAHQPLLKDIAHNAHAAAFTDPRFPPLQASELNDLDIHISILSPPEPMLIESEADLLQQMRPSIDGLILEDGNQRATFLPSVWESLPTAEEFLQHLKRKAGLPANYWSPSIKVSRYTTESF